MAGTNTVSDADAVFPIRTYRRDVLVKYHHHEVGPPITAAKLASGGRAKRAPDSRGVYTIETAGQGIIASILRCGAVSAVGNERPDVLPTFLRVVTGEGALAGMLAAACGHVSGVPESRRCQCLGLFASASGHVVLNGVSVA
jgi:hypothetical protein